MEYVELLSKQFLGKPCTVITHNTPLPLKDGLQHSRYFTGEVRRIDQYGIWLKGLVDGATAFFSFPIIGIVEEPVIKPDDPRYSKVKENVEKLAADKPKKPSMPPNFMSVDELIASLKK